MHYKNGRQAAEGDRVLNVVTGESGLLYGRSAQSSTCNARLAKVTLNDPWVTIGDCLLLDDIAAADVPDRSEGRTAE